MNILITGSTDGIGYETAKALVSQGHTVLLHGRNQAKLDKVYEELIASSANVESYCADLSDLKAVHELANDIKNKHQQLDVLINNAGILKTPNAITTDGMDVRFVVNTLAPYLLTQELLPLMNKNGRVINLSSAAQAPVNLEALQGKIHLSDAMAAYAQSKLAITMWSKQIGEEMADSGPLIVSVNPGSLLASKMVKEGFGIAGNDIQIGADILVRATLSDEFEGRYGEYFDNDSGRFSPPHQDAMNKEIVASVVKAIEQIISS